MAEKTFACMKAAYDSGVNFFDSAEGYAGTHPFPWGLHGQIEAFELT